MQLYSVFLHSKASGDCCPGTSIDSREAPEMVNVTRGDDGNVAQPGCRQGLSGENRVGMERVGVGRWHAGVADMRPEGGSSE
jgi:hypothetical protein